LARVGSTASDSYTSLSEMLHFLGEVTLAFVQLLKARARFRKGDLFLIIEECRPQVAFNCLRRFYRLDCSSSRTSAVLESVMSKAFAAACDRSMIRFSAFGPRSRDSPIFHRAVRGQCGFSGLENALPASTCRTEDIGRKVVGNGWSDEA